MRKTALASTLQIACMLLLGSCSSAPRPPTVDESHKRPANTAMGVDLQLCRNDLKNTRILATESGWMAQSATASLQQASARQQALAALQERAVPLVNSVFTVRFEFGSTKVAIPAEMTAALVDQAHSAPLIVLRGRTDGTTDTAAETRIARQRAFAVRDYLVAAGLDAARIRATYQPVGDPAADNTAAAGRAMNRRVEIELYRALPVTAGVAVVSTGSGSLQP